MLIIRPRSLAAALVFALTSAVSTPSFADLSGNAGWVNEYIFRGVPQKTSSASAGIDFEHRGFYVGTWGADVGDGLEIDTYLGYTFDLENVTLSIGGTGYFYTGDFDDTYKELNFGVGSGLFSLDIAVGQYENFAGPTLDYTHSAATLEFRNFYGTLGNFSQDFEGIYVDLGYSFDIAEQADFKISWIYADKDLALNPDPNTGAARDDHTIVFGVSKTFSLAP